VTDLIIDASEDMGTLGQFGYSSAIKEMFESYAEEGTILARVARVDRGMPIVVTDSGFIRAEPASHLRKGPKKATCLAVVGDWVALLCPEGHRPVIQSVLPRSSEFSRKDPGSESGQQVLIANIDIVFVMQSLSGSGVNVNRLERELVLAWNSGAAPVIVLTKADLVEDPARGAALASEVAGGVEVIVESAVTGEGIDEIRRYIQPGMTAALLGSSGVGKSTLVNRLMGEKLAATNQTRDFDDKGRHTTVAREMFPLPGEGVVIDTPGMRGLSLWSAERGMKLAFSDIEQLAQGCRFADCKHVSEPGCALIEAVKTGEISERRLRSWHTLRAELDELAARQVYTTSRRRSHSTERKGNL